MDALLQPLSTEPPESVLISVRSVTEKYETTSTVALDNVSLDIAPGEFISLVGPSGCGKSTLLKIVSGLMRQTSGDVALEGRALSRPSKDVGLVFQSPVLLPWRSILENVLFPVEVQYGHTKAFQERALGLLDKVGLLSFKDSYPHQLSGGMQQRASIVRALVQDPKVLLMDEPFGALDAMTREQMNVLLLDIWSEHKKTVVFVTHSIPESVFLSDRVVVMTPRPGRIEQVLDISLNRPRELSVINTERFGQYASHIRKLLNAKEDITG